MKKPMLLSNDEFDLNILEFINMFQSKKRDGVRAEITNQGIKNRSFKILRNPKVQNYFKEVYEDLPDDIILEAEVYSPTNPCRVIAGICNSDDRDIPKDLKLYIFGIFDDIATFEERIPMIHKVEDNYLKGNRYKIVEQIQVHSSTEAQEFYDKAIKDGYEGAVLMDGRKKYKQGRVTINQHIGFKMKPHKELDLPILGVTERFLNLNESKTNELGHSFKRNTVDAKEGTGIAATFICQLENGETTKVTITGDEQSRKEIWKNQNKYIGKFAVVKSMDYGVKDKLRHARLLKIKDAIEK